MDGRATSFRCDCRHYRCSLPGSDLFTFSGQGFVTPVSAGPFQFFVSGRILAALGDRLLLARPDTAHGAGGTSDGKIYKIVPGS